MAGAVKELVSNSFDADATRVVISTGYPTFERVKVVDNGLGMTEALFRKAMGSIGSSLKGILEPRRVTPVFRRPVIGYLGIGLMGLTQVCNYATIESQSIGSDTKFVAELDFSQFRKRKQKQIKTAAIDIFRELPRRHGGIEKMTQRLRELDPQSDADQYSQMLAELELATEAEGVFADQGMEEPESEHLGYAVLYPGLQAVPGEHGTTITLTRLDEAVRASLMDQGRSPDAMPQHYRDRDTNWDEYRDVVNSWSWTDLCKRLQAKASQLTYQSLPRYHQLLWELSVMTPVQYLEGGPVLLKPDLLKRKKDQLNAYNFSVLVDNRRLLKPTLLPSGAMVREGELESGYDYYLGILSEDETVDGDPLKYEGYIFWQRKQVEPSTARGIQVYIRNVGVGLYDQTLMGFSVVNPTSRAGQMSGEIYVDEGLERALNVDRSSFRETDAHYVALQERLWTLIGSATRQDGIMGMSVDAFWKRKGRREEQAYEQHARDLKELVQEASGGRLKLRLSEKDRPEPYEVRADQIIVYDHSPSWPRKASDRPFCQRLLVPVKAAIVTGGSVEEILTLAESILLR